MWASLNHIGRKILATVGLISPGELGSALAQVLRSRGMPVLATLEGRSMRTRELSLSAGIREVPSLPDLIKSSDIVISAVHPGAAEEVAAGYLAAAREVPAGQVFMDVNSIS